VRPELFRIPMPEWLCRYAPDLFPECLGVDPCLSCHIAFPAYFVLLITGFAVGTALTVMRTRQLGQDPDVLVDAALAALLMGVVGGRIFHVLFDGYFWDYVHLCTDPGQVDWLISEAECASPRYAGRWDAVRGVCHPTETDCWAWAKFWAGGLTYFGGLLFASVFCIYLIRRDRFPVWKATDYCALAIAIGLGFGRIGCLLAGCCFGKPADGPLSLSFPPYSPASEAQAKLGLLDSRASPSLPVLPMQIYESAACFAIAAVCLLVVDRRKRYDGQVFLAFLVLYSVARFALEFFRADDRGGLWGLSTSQLVGLAIMVGALWVHRLRLRQVARA